jgi:hypothetical protein
MTVCEDVDASHVDATAAKARAFSAILVRIDGELAIRYASGESPIEAPIRKLLRLPRAGDRAGRPAGDQENRPPLTASPPADAASRWR